MKNVIKFLRYILVIPVVLLAVSIVYWVFGYLLTWFLGLSLPLLIVVILFLGGTIWGIFQLLTVLLMYFISKISPNKMFSVWTISIVSIISCIVVIYRSWTIDTDYDGGIIFAIVVFNVLLIELTWALIAGAIAASDNE